MKTFYRTLLTSILSLTLLMSGAIASERVENVLLEDSLLVLTKLETKYNTVKKQRSDLGNIETNLRRTKKGQSIYLKFESIAGSLIVIGIIIGSYKAYFPPGFRAMAGAYVTVTGISHGLIKLSANDVQKLLVDIVKLNNVLDKSEESIELQAEYHCALIEGNYYHTFCR
ncbi:hypothetical protein [Bacteriovorax stolpii]|nr:hypothetical protein [Bacteriovorax stolpii]